MQPKNASNVGHPDVNKPAHPRLGTLMVRDRVLGGGGGGGGGGQLLISCPAVLDRIKDDWEFVIDPEVRSSFFYKQKSLLM
jgi:hypothetical protein